MLCLVPLLPVDALALLAAVQRSLRTLLLRATRAHHDLHSIRTIRLAADTTDLGDVHGHFCRFVRDDVEDGERRTLWAAEGHLERDLERISWEGREDHARLLVWAAPLVSQAAEGAHGLAAVMQSRRVDKRFEVDEVRVAAVHIHDVLSEEVYAHDAMFLAVDIIVNANAFVDPRRKLENVDCSVDSLPLVVIVWETEDDCSFVPARAGLSVLPGRSKF